MPGACTAISKAMDISGGLFLLPSNKQQEKRKGLCQRSLDGILGKVSSLKLWSSIGKTAQSSGGVIISGRFKKRVIVAHRDMG